MLYSTRLKCAAAIFGLVTTGVFAATALASPPSNVTTLESGDGQAERDDSGEQRPRQVPDQGRDRRPGQNLTFAAGAYTGWHRHPGLVVVVVESGSLVLTDASCGSRTYGPGAPNGAVFVEGDEHAHIASSPAGAIVFVTYVVPSATPPTFRIEEPVSSCAVP